MTAETLVGPRAKSGFPTYGAMGPGAGELQVAWGNYAVTAAAEDGDIWELCKVPAGARLMGGFFVVTDGDTGSEAVEIDLGWKANGGSGTYDSASVDGLVDSGVLTGDGLANVYGAGVDVRVFEIVPGVTYFTKATTIQAECIAPPATHQNFTLGCCVFFTVDPSVAV